MKFKEHLTWILDKRVHRFNDEDKYQQNIDFVHSLGKKCDCVGWSELDMDEDDADEVLDKIEAFCKEQGWRARGCMREHILMLKAIGMSLSLKTLRKTLYSMFSR